MELRAGDSERIVVYMPKLGHTTGEMPHLRNPPNNWMPGQQLYYLYTACRNMGYPVRVVDANFSIDPIARTLEFAPTKILLTTATPTFEDTQRAITALREAGFAGTIFVSGPHVSLNAGLRDWLLPEMEGVVYIPLVSSASTFDWVPTVFPDRSIFEVMGCSEEEAKRQMSEQFIAETGRDPNEHKLEAYLFTYFMPSIEWMSETYTGDHIKPEMKQVPIRYSIITSVGCNKTCSFCGNPYIYRIGFKSPAVVRQILRNYKQVGIDRLSVHDMFFVMHLPHTEAMMKVFKEEAVTYSMQTCLENLTDELMSDLKDSGLQKLLVGVENPVSYSVGKRVEMERLRWLMDKTRDLKLAGAKLSYIVGLPGVAIGADFALLDHIVEEVVSRNHPLEDLQVNLYTPYRPESDTTYSPRGAVPPASVGAKGRLPMVGQAEPARLHVEILDKLPFGYWGCFPVGIGGDRDFWRQMVLCDIVYDKVYTEFREPYLALREKFVADVVRIYPDLAPHVPTFAESRHAYLTTTRSDELTRAVGNDEGRGRAAGMAEKRAD